MMSRWRLRARAGAPAGDAVSAAALSGIVLKPLGHRPLVLPRTAPEWWDSAAVELAVFGQVARAVLYGLFKDPARCYELKAQPGQRRLALVSPVVHDDVILVTGVLTVGLSPRRQVLSWGSLVIETAALSAVEAREQILRLSEQLTDESLRARDPDGPPLSALVVGDLDSATRSLLLRRLWGYGVRVGEVLEQPYRNSGTWARERIRQYGGDLIVLLQAGCGQAFGVLLSEIRDQMRLVLLAEEDVDLLGLELEEGLEAAGVDSAEAAGAVTEGDPSDSSELPITVEDAAQRIVALPDPEGRFVLTERCIRRLKDELSTNPKELAEQATRLREFALRWSRSVSAGGLGGDVVVIARTEHDLVLARTDEPMRRAKLDKFDHDGQSYSRETHVKVTDHTSLSNVARIHFAFDNRSRPPRLIVDHIGSKISPYVKR
ncbi:MAG TPA: hypothetical protein VG294_00375 [Solirubrobacteraceae bacterium]|jgi:hypothetical protein|nr:hypothetical protein [Solirubrobacteraceae bacterium]